MVSENLGGHDGGMATSTRSQRRYDHRLKELVRRTGNIDHAVGRGVPRSTARGWMKRPGAEVVTIDVVNKEAAQLQQEVLQLRRRVQKLTALLRVLLAVVKVSDYSLDESRLPDAAQKRTLLRAINRSNSVLPLRCVLRTIRLSPSRYHAWNRKEQCALDDRPSCPRCSTHQLTPNEVSSIRRKRSGNW